MDRNQLLDRYRQTRALSVELCRPLRPEDYRIQSMPDVSPPWWNLGHTTWFFAKNILEPFGLYTRGATPGWSSSSTPTTSRWGRASAATTAGS